MTLNRRSGAQRRWAVAALWIVPASVSLAAPPLDQPGTFSHACAGKSNGNSYLGIRQEGSFFADQFVCHERFDPLGGKVSTKANYKGPTGGTANDRGMARMGTAQGHASNTALLEETGRAIAGFTDRLTIDAPGLTNQLGYLSFELKVRGHLEGHGPGSSDYIVAEAWVDGKSEQGDVVDKLTWEISTFPTEPDASLTVNETVEMRVWFVFGRPFALATTLTTTAGTRGVGGSGNGNSASDPPGLRWNGITTVTDRNGVVRNDWSFASESGIDWRLPCPCSPP